LTLTTYSPWRNLSPVGLPNGSSSVQEFVPRQARSSNCSFQFAVTAELSSSATAENAWIYGYEHIVPDFVPLTIMYQVGTDDQVGTQVIDTESIDDEPARRGRKSDEKDRGNLRHISNLSGGEKSFATVCLLLAVWRNVHCPVRCLDEFDVFMDAENRHTTSEMMVNQVKGTNGTQHVFLSPLDIHRLTGAQGTTILRLGDPR
jgi:hypothetical protein